MLSLCVNVVRRGMLQGEASRDWGHQQECSEQLRACSVGHTDTCSKSIPIWFWISAKTLSISDILTKTKRERLFCATIVRRDLWERIHKSWNLRGHRAKADTIDDTWTNKEERNMCSELLRNMSLWAFKTLFSRSKPNCYYCPLVGGGRGGTQSFFQIQTEVLPSYLESSNPRTPHHVDGTLKWPMPAVFI